MPRDNCKKIGFLLLGGIHHILHLIPVAAKMQDHSDLDPVIFVRSEEEARLCANTVARLGRNPVQIQQLKMGALLAKSAPKLSALFANLKPLLSVDCLVVAERTSTILKRLPVKIPPMIHIPHGAGDRAKSYDKRIKHFDHVIVAGPKDKRRMIEHGLVSDRNCSVSGYVKAAALKVMFPSRPKLFDNSKPIVLYNPHFEPRLSSWSKFGIAILEAFTDQDKYNLIFAPHIRLFGGNTPGTIASFSHFAEHKHIIIDLGSEASTDMTYTHAADLYMGDVSSQVYEYLIDPGPCIFLSRVENNWQTDPDYAHWQYGSVLTGVENLTQAIDRAFTDHATYLTVQIHGRDQALGEPGADALSNAVNQIASFAKGFKKQSG